MNLRRTLRLHSLLTSEGALWNLYMGTEFVTLMYQTSKLFLVLLGLLCTSDFNFDVSTRIITNFLQSCSQQGCRRTEF